MEDFEELFFVKYMTCIQIFSTLFIVEKEMRSVGEVRSKNYGS